MVGPCHGVAQVKTGDEALVGRSQPSVGLLKPEGIPGASACAGGGGVSSRRGHWRGPRRTFAQVRAASHSRTGPRLSPVLMVGTQASKGKSLLTDLTSFSIPYFFVK